MAGGRVETMKEKAFFQFKIRVGTSNAAKLTKDVEKLVKDALLADPEITGVIIQENYS